MMSDEPPGGYGTMMRTGRVGQFAAPPLAAAPACCAQAGTKGDRHSAAAPPRKCLLLTFMLSPHGLMLF
ncbi:hypothetical protein D3C85_289700 [compost metagenome]